MELREKERERKRDAKASKLEQQRRLKNKNESVSEKCVRYDRCGRRTWSWVLRVKSEKCKGRRERMTRRIETEGVGGTGRERRRKL